MRNAAGRIGRRGRRLARGLLLLALLLLLTGCRLTQSEFANKAGQAAGELAAAATTLEFLHAGKLPGPFARSAFAGYADALAGSEQLLRSADGAPRGSAIEDLLAQLRAAVAIVERPCLGGGCDWRAQVASLRAASDALNRAAEAA